MHINVGTHVEGVQIVQVNPSTSLINKISRRCELLGERRREVVGVLDGVDKSRILDLTAVSGQYIWDAFSSSISIPVSGRRMNRRCTHRDWLVYSVYAQRGETVSKENEIHRGRPQRNVRRTRGPGVRSRWCMPLWPKTSVTRFVIGDDFANLPTRQDEGDELLQFCRSVRIATRSTM